MHYIIYYTKNLKNLKRKIQNYRHILYNSYKYDIFSAKRGYYVICINK